MTKRTVRAVHYAEEDSDDDTFLTIKRKHKRPKLSKVKRTSSSDVRNGDNNSDDEFVPKKCNGNAVGKYNSGRRRSNDSNYQRSRKHPQVNADLSRKKRISHRRSLCSLGLVEVEEGTSCDDDDDDGIGALATSQRRRSTSRDSFPNMLLRRSNRKKKTRFKTLDLSNIEDASTLEETAENEEPSARRVRDRSIKPELRDLLIAQGKSPDDLQSLQPPDIYSSIKSRQRQPKKFFDDEFTKLPDHVPSDADELTPKRELEENTTGLENFEKSEENEAGDDEKIKNNIDERLETENKEDDGEQEEKELEENEDNDEDDEDDEDDDDDESEEEDNSDDRHHVTRRKYSLRKKRVQPSRLVDELKRQTRRGKDGIFDRVSSSVASRRGHKSTKSFQQNTASPYQQRELRTYSQGGSTTSVSSGDGGDDDERKFERRKKKSMAKARNRCLPMNLTINDLSTHGFSNERKKIGSSLADVDPMNIDKTVRFDSIGGHRKHVRSLKEMVVFPLLYPEVFQKFNINPPRGCLFYGPPGTGKTLMARALANECSTEGKKVAFFMRKGADCLSKWVGESERQLRLLFDQAYQMRPSIIFFDEIDGLAPVRSSRQDQIHSSIVSTLLGLMDGLDNRGEIIVIGATNRIDSIDPALRRPGRFDREFLFSLPDKKARREILTIHTRKWIPPLSEHFMEELAERTSGYCGADLMALCAESTLFALRRHYPQIYASNDKLKLNVDSINVTSTDFRKATKNIIPTSQRSASNPARVLAPILRPLLAHKLRNAVIQLAKLFPLIKKRSKLLHSIQDEHQSSHVTVTSESESDFEEDEERHHGRLNIPLNGISLPPPMSGCVFRESKIHRPRMLICGSKGDGHSSHLAPALLYDLEGLPVHVLDIPVLYGTSTRTPEESCAQIFREALRSTPSIVYMPNAPTWWKSTNSTVHETFKSLLYNLSTNIPVLLIATANCSPTHLPRSLKQIFRPQNTKILNMTSPSTEERMAFFSPVFLQLPFNKPLNRERRKLENLEVLEKVSSSQTIELSEKELEKIEYQEESTMTNLRLFLRDVLTRLARDRRFKVFLKPVDTEEVPDYAEVVDKPMDLSTMMGNIDRHLYCNVQSFIHDINLICTNALEYNPDRSAEDRAIRHRACLLRDMTHAIVQNELEPSFEKLCNEVIEARKKRNADPLKFAPSNFAETSKHRRISKTLSSTPRGERKARKDSGSFFGVSVKRKKPSAWASGIIRKYKKKSLVDDGSSVEEEDTQMADDEAPQEAEEDVRVNSNASDGENKVTKTASSSEDAKEEEENTNECSEEESNNRCSNEEDKNGCSNEEDKKGSSNEEENNNGCSEEEEEVKNNNKCSDEEEHSNGCSEEEQKEESENSGSVRGELEDEASTDIVISTLQDDKEAEYVEKERASNPELSTSSTSSEEEVEETVRSVNQSSSEKDSCAEDKAENSINLSANQSSDKDEGMEVQCDVKPCVGSSEVLPKQEESPPSPQLIIDEQKLKNLLYYTVQATSHLRVEDLESLYSSLIRCVFRHQNNYDKSLLIQELPEEVDQFLEFFEEETDQRNDSFS